MQLAHEDLSVYSVPEWQLVGRLDSRPALLHTSTVCIWAEKGERVCVCACV